eukprot:8263902-Pyramimonas_sp.AAC.1
MAFIVVTMFKCGWSCVTFDSYIVDVALLMHGLVPAIISRLWCSLVCFCSCGVVGIEFCTDSAAAPL